MESSHTLLSSSPKPFVTMSVYFLCCINLFQVSNSFYTSFSPIQLPAILLTFDRYIETPTITVFVPRLLGAPALVGGCPLLCTFLRVREGSARNMQGTSAVIIDHCLSFIHFRSGKGGMHPGSNITDRVFAICV